MAAIVLNTLSVAGLVDGCDGVDDDDGNEPNENVFCGVAKAVVVAPVALPFGSPQHTHFVADASFDTKHVLQSHFVPVLAAFVVDTIVQNGAVDDVVAEPLDGLSPPQQRHFFADLLFDTKHDAHSHLSCFCFALIDWNSSKLSSVDACDKRTATSSLADSKPVDLFVADPNDCVVSAMPLSDVIVLTVFDSNRKLPRLVFASTLI